MKSEKQNAPINTQTQDLAVFGFRLAVVVALTAILLFGGGNTGVTGTQGVFMAFLVSLAAGLVLVVFAMVPSLNPYAMWAVMIGDWVTVGAFGLVVYDNPPLVLLLLVGVGAVSHVRLGALWGAVSNAVNVLVFAGVMGYAAGTVDRMTALLPSYGVMLALLVVVTAGIATLMHLRDSQLQSRTLSMRTQAEQRMAMVKDMQERTVAITEMAQMLGSTLNYQRILDAALSVGRLALHEKNNTGFISMVLLFRPEDRMLYIETARGLSRHDEQRVVAGKAGLVGDTLRLCEPMFGGVIRKDPELRQFHSLQQARSLVTVPLRAGYDNYGVMVFASQQPNAFNERYQVFLEAVGIHTTIALQNAVLYQNLADEKERLVEVEEEARHKLARDLHDGPTQAV
ncbi:MAG: GAF domain-containing protein, partial [Chloroflexota bacterium]